MRIHIFGASGSGVTTLGNALANQLDIPYFDADDYYWHRTTPPFQTKRDPVERNLSLSNDLSQHPGWILGGSLDSWGNHWPALFDLVIFLWTPTDIRVQRLWQREYDRYGIYVQQDEAYRQRSEAFINWATEYDSGKLPGCSKPRHEAWMAQLSCPILRLEGDLTVAERLAAILQRVR